MGLRDALRTAARTVVAAAGNIASNSTYLSHAGTSYNASTGVVTATFSTVAGVTVVFDEFRISEIDGRVVKPEDKKAFVPALSLASVVPAPEDQIVHDSTTWEVVSVRVDPAESLYELQLRRP